MTNNLWLQMSGAIAGGLVGWAIVETLRLALGGACRHLGVSLACAPPRRACFAHGVGAPGSAGACEGPLIARVDICRPIPRLCSAKDC